MHFGHGKYTCPGRFFAFNEMKMVLATMLLRYEVKYPEGASRPANMNIDEYIFVFPELSLLTKRVDYIRVYIDNLFNIQDIIEVPF